MELRLLGPLELHAGGGVVDLSGQKKRAVLALLALYADRPLTVATLLDRVWGADHPPTAEAALRNCVSALRKVLPADGPVRLTTVSQGYRLRVEGDALDVAVLRRLLPRARLKLRAGEAAEAADLLDRATRLWRGPALIDLLDVCAGWPEITELEELRLATLEEKIAADLALGRHRLLVPLLERLIRAHPGRERLYRHHMTALYRAGRQAHAISAYRHARTVLTRDAGRDSPELDELYRSILEQRADLAAPRHRAAPESPPRPARRERRRGRSASPGGDIRLVTLACLRLHSPAEGDTVQAAALAVVQTHVQNLGGRVEHVVGSTVVASFGVTGRHRDAAGFAVHAALTLRTRLAARDCAVSAAVVTGPVLIREVPADGPARARIVGQVVDAGTELLASTPDGLVRVDDATRRSSRRLVRYDLDSAQPARGAAGQRAPWWIARTATLLPRPDGPAGH